MINDEIIKYVAKERARGVEDATLHRELMSKGWGEQDIAEVLRTSTSDGTPVPAAFPVKPKCPPSFSWEYVQYLFEGRIGRLYYFEGGLIIILATILIMFLAAGVLYYLDFHFGALIFLWIPLWLLFTIFHYSLMVRRLHDLDHSGWFLLITFIPVVNLFFALYVLFRPGTPGSNRYGPPEPYVRTTRAAWNALFRK